MSSPAPGAAEMAALGPIREGDIVLVDKKGRKFHALVNGKEPGELKIAACNNAPSITYFTATAREVIGHWRQTKNGR